MDLLVSHYFQLFSHFRQKKRKIPFEWGSPLGQTLHPMAAGSLKSLLWSPAPSSPPTALPDLAPQPNSLGLIKAIFLLKTVTYFGTRLNESTYQNTSPKTLRICQFMGRSGLFLQNRSDPILMPFNLKTLFSSLPGRSSWQPQNFSRVNQQLSSLKPWPPRCTAGDRGAPGSLDLPRERATSVTVLKAESCAQELPELKAVSSPDEALFVTFFPRAMCN